MVIHRCCWVAFVVQLLVDLFFGIYVFWTLPLIVVGVLLPYFLAPPRGAKEAARRTRSAKARSAGTEAVGPGAAGTEAPQAVEVSPPVTGRWTALNSPADKIPSHGTHTYGQTYAIDVVAEGDADSRPAFGWWPLSRSNADFPAFGAPVLAAGEATVVHAVGHRRDHLSRNSFPALIFLTLEGFLRSIGGSGQITGNTVVLDLGDDTYALYAHLQQGSLSVRKGDRVLAGQQIGLCGNSGNSSEPHVHFHLMDDPDPDVAGGRPFSWNGIGVPANGESFSADIPAAP